MAYQAGGLAGAARPEPQAGPHTYAPKLAKEMAHLDGTESALAIHRRVRALQPWPAAELKVQGQVLKVLGVGGLRPSPEAPGTLRWDKGGAWLTAGDGQALELTRLQRAGKPVQPALQALQPWGSQGLLRSQED